MYNFISGLEREKNEAYTGTLGAVMKILRVSKDGDIRRRHWLCGNTLKRRDHQLILVKFSSFSVKLEVLKILKIWRLSRL